MRRINTSYGLMVLSIILIAISSGCSDKKKLQQQVSPTPQRSLSNTDNLANLITNEEGTLPLKFTQGVRSILEDSQGNIWFGSMHEGIAKYDGKKLTYFTEKEGLSSKQVRAIYEGTDGIIWFDCGEGISSYDGVGIINHPVKDFTAKNHWQANKDDLWFKGNEMNGYNSLESRAGVYQYNGSTKSYRAFPDLPKMEDATYSVSTPFVRGENERLWFGTYSAVIGYDNEAFTIIDNQSLGLDEETGYLHVRSLFEDSKGNLWIGNNGIGVLYYDGDTTINFSQKNGLVTKDGKHNGGFRSAAGSLEHVFAITEDQEGNMWFGDRDTGAWKYDGKSFTNYTTADGLTTHHIWQIYESKKGELWFAMADGSVNTFNGKSFERRF